LTFADILATIADMSDKQRPFSPAKGKTFEAVKVGNIVVKIYRREHATVKNTNRESYEVADYTTGRRKLRGFVDLDEARREADKIARQLSSGDAAAAMMRNADAASYGRSVELIRPTGASLEVVAAVYAKCYEILGRDAMIEACQFYKRHGADQIQTKPVPEVVTELIALREKRTKNGRPASKRYIKDLRSRLTRFGESFAVDISTLTKADIQRYLDGLNAAPQTVKNFRTVLNTLFSYAESRGYIFKGSNPVEETEQISSNGGKIEIYTPEEIGKLLNAAPKAFLPFVALAAFAGLRTAEIERLEWSDIDVAGGFIHIAADKAKTASRRLVPISASLAQWIAACEPGKGKVWNGGENDLKDLRAETVTAAKTEWKDNGLRHSFISYRLAEIQNAAQVALEAGNSAKVIFKHYRELVKPAQATQWFSIAPDTTRK
jgi:integrase